MSHSFTVKYAGQQNVLITSCSVSAIFDQANGVARPTHVELQAIWDTGATNSVITQSAVDALGLKATGMTSVHGVAGVSTCETYLVAIGLPNHVVFPNIKVTKGILSGGIGVLIGMDIIGGGDFSVTNKDSKTVFSFRFPSQTHVDFVQQHNQQALRASMTHGGAGKVRPKKPPKTHKKKK